MNNLAKISINFKERFYKLQLYVKLILTLVIFLLFYLCWPNLIKDINDNYKIEDLKVFQNYWLFLGIVISAILTFIPIGLIVIRALTGQNSKVFNKFQAFLLLFIPAILLLSVFWGFNNLSNSKANLIFSFGTIALALIILTTDYLFYKSGKFSVIKKNWPNILQFDLGVLFSLIAIFALAFLIKKSYNFEISSGFLAGANAFQLIMANLFFDLEYYELGKDEK